MLNCFSPWYEIYLFNLVPRVSPLPALSSLAPGGGKRRDPENEVAIYSETRWFEWYKFSISYETGVEFHTRTRILIQYSYMFQVNSQVHCEILYLTAYKQIQSYKRGPEWAHAILKVVHIIILCTLKKTWCPLMRASTVTSILLPA